MQKFELTGDARNATAKKIEATANSKKIVSENNGMITYDDGTFEEATAKIKTAASKKDTQIIAENSLNLFDKFAMTKQKREELKNMKYVIDGLFVEGYHSYLFGASGSGKTTILLNLCFEIVGRGYTVYFFYLDGELFSASKVSEKIESEDFQDKYRILTDGTMQNYSEILQKLIDAKEPLQKTVFVLDTFKFLSADVNNKNANKDAMHFIKNVCKLGATFISLGHTNKDGKKQSGTAEIEQDSDALLQIDSTGSIEDDSKIISTIKKGGRCRCTITSRSFEFVGGYPLSVVSLDSPLDIEGQKALIEIEQNDVSFIIEVQRLLYDGGEKSQKDLLKMLEDFGIGKNKMMKMLKFYTGKKWEEKKGDNNASIYFLKDDFLKQWANAGQKILIDEEQIEPSLFDE